MKQQIHKIITYTQKGQQGQCITSTKEVTRAHKKHCYEHWAR